MTQSWLRDFLDYVKRNQGYEDINLNIDNQESFATALDKIYLADSNSPMRLDVEFNEDRTRVKAARFLIQVGSPPKLDALLAPSESEFPVRIEASPS